MYCIECGKPNPDQAKFCAFCGHRLLVLDTKQDPEPIVQPEQKPVLPELKPQEAARPAVSRPEEPPRSAPPRPEPVKSDPHMAFKRPAEGVTVRPLVDNPAQPGKSRAAIPPEIKPATQPAPPIAPRTPESKAVTSSGGQVTLPSRAPNVKRAKRYGEVTHRAPTTSPFGQAQKRLNAMNTGRKPAQGDDDLFFEDIDAVDDLEMGEDRLSKHLKWIIAVLFLLLVVSAVSWLFLSSSGQVFLAGIGMNASAEAYDTLGDQAAANGELKRAAEAYHDALRRDPSSYAYALKTGKAYQRIGDDEKAYAAYNKCIELNGKSPEPYRLLAEMWEKQGGAQAGEQMRQLGYEKTGDQSLLDKSSSPSQEADDLVPAA